MNYVYQQQARPEILTGVQVKIESYDPNGNYQNYGTTSTDAYGNFGLAFEPEVAGTYWIMATFEGSNSYYGSQASTYLQVEPASTPTIPIEPEEPEQPTEPEQPATEAPLISSEVAIIAAVAVIAVVGVAAYWILRKRQ